MINNVIRPNFARVNTLASVPNKSGEVAGKYFPFDEKIKMTGAQGWQDHFAEGIRKLEANGPSGKLVGDSFAPRKPLQMKFSMGGSPAKFSLLISQEGESWAAFLPVRLYLAKKEAASANNRFEPKQDRGYKAGENRDLDEFLIFALNFAREQLKISNDGDDSFLAPIPEALQSIPKRV